MVARAARLPPRAGPGLSQTLSRLRAAAAAAAAEQRESGGEVVDSGRYGKTG